MTNVDFGAVLATHRIVSDVFSPYCACGKWRDKRDDGTKHRAHVAAALTAELVAAQAEAWDEAAQAVAWVLTNGPTETAAEYLLAQNPYRAALAALAQAGGGEGE